MYRWPLWLRALVVFGIWTQISVPALSTALLHTHQDTVRTGPPHSALEPGAAVVARDSEAPLVATITESTTITLAPITYTPSCINLAR